MNSIFELNTEQKYHFFHFWLLAGARKNSDCPKNCFAQLMGPFPLTGSYATWFFVNDVFYWVCSDKYEWLLALYGMERMSVRRLV